MGWSRKSKKEPSPTIVPNKGDTRGEESLFKRRGLQGIAVKNIVITALDAPLLTLT